MDIDSSVVLDYLVPDSPNDAGAVLLWVFLILLVILVIIDIRMYVEYRKTPQKKETQPQGLPLIEPMKKSKEGTEQSYVDIRTKVDQLIEINKL